MNKQTIEKNKPLLFIYRQLLLEDKGLERDEINAVKLRKKLGKDVYDMGGRDPFFNNNLSYAHEEFRVKMGQMILFCYISLFHTLENLFVILNMSNSYL